MSSSRPLAQSDQALAASLRAWGGDEALRLARHFDASTRRTLASASVAGPDEALARLRDARNAQIGPDLARVHPTWLIRALLDESPSVRRTVTSAATEPLRSILLQALDLEAADLVVDHPAESRAVAWALGLWTERLVGDLAHRDDDSPAIRTLTGMSPFGCYRLLRLCGLAKLSMMGGNEMDSGMGRSLARLTFFRERLAGDFDPRLLVLASSDRAGAVSLGRHRLAGLGLATVGRLLAAADPYRLRWALQHVPYPVAKRLRSFASQPQAAVKAILAWEARTLEAVVERLEAGRGASLFGAREGSPAREL